MSDINTALGIESTSKKQDANVQTSCFDGRARRSEYWSVFAKRVIPAMLIGLLLILFILVAICAAARSYGSSDDSSIILIPCTIVISVLVISVLVGVFCCLSMWPVTVRRLHDRGMSGWWLLWFVLLSWIPVIGWMAGIVQFVIIGCMDGTPGPNQYGPDPKGRNWVQDTNPHPVVGIVNNNTNVATTVPSNTEDRLVKLNELKHKGLISEEEYEKKRSQIISDL